LISKCCCAGVHSDVKVLGADLCPGIGVIQDV
jgi:hypothetical protein